MSQSHALTKRNRRQKSHKRGHEGQKTQFALRSPEAKAKALRQGIELVYNTYLLAEEAKQGREAREAKRNAVKKGPAREGKKFFAGDLRGENPTE